jgi:hypothetical protein
VCSKELTQWHFVKNGKKNVLLADTIPDIVDFFTFQKLGTRVSKGLHIK